MKILDLYENSSVEVPFLKQFPEPLYHGTEKLSAGAHAFKEREKPRDTFTPVHNTLSKLSKEKLGVDVRSLLFASFDEDDAQEFGKVYRLIPLGDDYRLFASKYTIDLTVNLKVQKNMMNRELMSRLRYLDRIKWEPNDIREMEVYVSRDVQNNFQGGVGEFFDAYIEKALGILSDYDEVTDEFKEKMVSIIRRYEKQINTAIEKYIDELFEVTSEKQLMNSRTEIMVYAPSGFELKEITD